MKKIAILAVLISTSAAAQPMDPEKQALAYEVQECMSGKIRATANYVAAQTQIEDLKKQLQEAKEKEKKD